MRARIARIEDIGGPLPQPVAGVRVRHGLRVTVADQRGRAGIGEASPLPGYSPDTLESCRSALVARAAGSIELDLEAPGAEALARASEQVRPPAARFALESALLDLASQALGRPAHQLIAHDPAARVAVSALVPAGPRALAVTRQAWDRGVRCFKVKVGPDPEGGIELLRALRTELGPGAALRADANGAWEPRAAARHLARLAEVGIELIEEPTALGALDQLERTTAAGGAPPVPIALDESLARPDVVDWLPPLVERGRVQIVVLKPALLGGLGACAALAAVARAAGAEILVTHMFDGPVALRACRALALALAPERACAIDLHPFLAAYDGPAPAPADRGWIFGPTDSGLEAL
jgi:L-Ala-D/L-Glu epimerase